MPQPFLTALPVFNEVNHVAGVIAEVRKYSPDILIVNDGSTDGTADVLAEMKGVHRLHHPRNLGYGAALRTAFEFAIEHEYEVLVTIDCDGQHEPCRIPQFVAACAGWDIISGSRYLQQYAGDSAPPPERRHINGLLTAEINRRLGLALTDAFCGFKAYRVEALKQLHVSENGYAMPLEVWAQAARAGFRIRELPVPLIYLDEERSFGGSLDNAEIRLRHYREVFERAIAAAADALQSCRGERAG